MNALKRDANHQLTKIREGGLIGARVSHSGITADTWYRLCPNGNDAAVGTNPDTFDLQTLRSDIANHDIKGWFFKILTEGYKRTVRVSEANAAVVTVEYMLAMKRPTTENLPATLEYVLYPDMVLPMQINHSDDADDDMEVGFLNQDIFALADANITVIETLSPGEALEIPTDMVDRIVYNFPTYTAMAANPFSWGEIKKMGTS